MGWDALEPSEQRWFAEHAEAALARRDGAIGSLTWRWLDWVLTGAIGLLGLFWLGWSGPEAALLLVLRHWSGWCVDLLQWRLRSAARRMGYAQDYDDRRFWQIVALLRGRRARAPDARADPGLGFAVAVDLVAGAVASVLILQGLQAGGAALADALAAPDLLVAAALLVALGVLPTLHARLLPNAGGSVALPVFRAGQRGIGLLVLAFGLMAAGGGRLDGAWLAGAAYAFFLLMGSIELAFGVPAARAEAAWLRRRRDGVASARRVRVTPAAALVKCGPDRPPPGEGRDAGQTSRRGAPHGGIRWA